MALLRHLLVNGQNSAGYTTDCSLPLVATKVFQQIFTMLLKLVLISVCFSCLSIQTTLSRATNRFLANRFYTLEITRNLPISLKYSLKNLRTDYIDLLYAHWRDWDTSIEEVMGALHNLILKEKVLYLVCSSIYRRAVSSN
jgi:predicted oxidoreductase